MTPVSGSILLGDCVERMRELESGSGSNLVEAQSLGRRFLGLELDANHHRTASRRLQCA
jgi:hypothetical protein